MLYIRREIEEKTATEELEMLIGRKSAWKFIQKHDYLQNVSSNFRNWKKVLKIKECLRMIARSSSSFIEESDSPTKSKGYLLFPVNYLYIKRAAQNITLLK